MKGPTVPFINIHLTYVSPQDCLQESKGGFNNRAIRWIDDT